MFNGLEPSDCVTWKGKVRNFFFVPTKINSSRVSMLFFATFRCTLYLLSGHDTTTVRKLQLPSFIMSHQTHDYAVI